MIIEFSGPSGAGKSTCIRQLVATLERQDIPNGCVHSADLNNAAAIPSVLSEVQGQNWRTDLRLLPWTAWFFLRHPALFAFVVARLVHLQEGRKEKLSILRSVGRKAGTRAYLDRRRFANVAVVVDEGLVHIAHNLLMSAYGVAKQEDIRRFVAHIPPPDHLVIVTAKPETLVKRLTRRGDLSPRIKTPALLGSFAQNAWRLFSLMANEPAKASRRVWRSDEEGLGEAIAALAEDIAASTPHGFK